MPLAERFQQEVSDALREMREDIREMRAELNGPLIGVGRLPVRDRLHELEKDRYAVRLAEQYLDRAKEIRDATATRRMGWVVTLLVGLGAALVGKFA